MRRSASRWPEADVRLENLLRQARREKALESRLAGRVAVVAEHRREQLGTLAVVGTYVLWTRSICFAAG
jgi:hypothetical protein